MSERRHAIDVEEAKTTFVEAIKKSQCLAVCQNMCCFFLSGRIHGSRGRRLEKKEKLRWKMIRLFQHLLKFFPFSRLYSCSTIFLLSCSGPHFIILKLQAISMLIGRRLYWKKKIGIHSSPSIYFYAVYTVNKVE